ncbi:MAG TPA: class I SAM-dependent methyltransferase [Polyangiaceae bacterium]|nr:class I SAM-dependent methyltransferase [Polyangiaceae bacterium]
MDNALEPRGVHESAAARRDAPDEALEEVPCPLCGADDPELVLYARDRLFARPGRYRIVQCRACKLRYLSPRPTLAGLGLHYPNEYFIYRTPDEVPLLARPMMSALTALRWRSYIERLERVRGRFTPESQVLDVGCGLNDCLRTLHALRGTEGVGVDFKPEIVAYVRSQCALRVVEGTLQDAHFPDGAFEQVMMNEYLEHEPNPRALLAEARRVTKKGGHLAVEVPFIEGLPAKLFGPYWSQVDAPRHLLHFTRATLEELLSRSGFRLIHTETFQVPMLVGMSVVQALGHRRVGRMGLLERVMISAASLPFFLLYPWLDEFIFAVAEAQ